MSETKTKQKSGSLEKNSESKKRVKGAEAVVMLLIFGAIINIAFMFLEPVKATMVMENEFEEIIGEPLVGEHETLENLQGNGLLVQQKTASGDTYRISYDRWYLGRPIQALYEKPEPLIETIEKKDGKMIEIVYERGE